MAAIGNNERLESELLLSAPPRLASNPLYPKGNSEMFSRFMQTLTTGTTKASFSIKSKRTNLLSTATIRRWSSTLIIKRVYSTWHAHMRS